MALGCMSVGGVLVIITGSALGVSSAWPLISSLVLLCALLARWAMVNRPRAAAAQ